MRAIGQAVSKLVKPFAAASGFAEHRLLCQWSQVVGPEVARHARPVRLTSGVLRLAVADGGWAMRLTAQSPQLMESINSFCGFGVVKSVRFEQAYFKTASPLPEISTASDTGAKVRAAAQVSRVGDDTLRDALLRLGTMVEAEVSPAASASSAA